MESNETRRWYIVQTYTGYENRVKANIEQRIATMGMEFYLQGMPELRQKTLDVHAMGRLAEPAEIADAVVYLCSDRASFITGHDLVVDGGVLVRSNVIDL